MTLGLIYWLVLLIAIIVWSAEHRVRPTWTTIVVVFLFCILGFAVFGAPLHSLR